MENNILSIVEFAVIELLARYHGMHTHNIHPEWHDIVTTALKLMDQEYLRDVQQSNNVIPSWEKTFNAFSMPKSQVKYILFGESPYPRIDSANGYAFWDNRVKKIWGSNGLSTEVNKATSLRNFIKMLLVAEKLLNPNDISQESINCLNKNNLIYSLDDLFYKLIDNGFLLLNSSLVLSSKSVSHDAKHWFPFLEEIIKDIISYNPHITLILFGKIANKIQSMKIGNIRTLIAEHPYNISFIQNNAVLKFFSQFKLIKKNE